MMNRQSIFAWLPSLLILGGLLVAGCAPTPAEVISVSASQDTVQTNQQVTFTAEINEDASRPVNYEWDFGNGESDSGEVPEEATSVEVTTSYSSAGQYDIQFTASNDADESGTGSTSLSVVPPPVPAQITGLDYSPNNPEAGQQVRFSSSVNGDSPLELSWRFGDGSTGSGSSPTHTYDEAGDYTVTLSASNEFGQDEREVSVTIDPALAEICTTVSEFSSVFFDRNSSTLTSDARSTLQDNLEILSQCPNLSVRVRGFASPFERNAQQLSSDRARAVSQFYQNNGIAGSRVNMSGEGEAEGQTTKKGAADQFRRVDSAPVRQGGGGGM
jgi:outer membrane protein OmpA-like peptidoglycan-associated protein